MTVEKPKKKSTKRIVLLILGTYLVIFSIVLLIKGINSYSAHLSWTAQTPLVLKELNKIDPMLVKLDLAETTGVTWNLGSNNLFRNGLVSYELPEYSDHRVFVLTTNLKSIHGLCNVTGGYAEAGEGNSSMQSPDTKKFNVKGVDNNFIANSFTYNIEKGSLLEDIKQVRVSIPNPFSKTDYHKNIKVVLDVDVEYPYFTPNSSNFWIEKGVIRNEFILYVISPEEMAKRLTVEKSSNKTNINFFVFACIIFTIGLFLFYKAKKAKT